MFKTLKAWYDHTLLNCTPPEKPVKDEWEMIGEPVKALILSMRNNPKRWKVRGISMSTEEMGLLYYWEKERPYPAYSLTDRLTGKEFRILEHSPRGMRLFTDVGFTLNGWEQRALLKAGLAHHEKAIQRIGRWKGLRLKRARELEHQQELAAREALKKELML